MRKTNTKVTRYSAPKLDQARKHSNFVRISHYRKDKILHDLKLIGNLAQRGYYDYSPDEVDRLFQEIMQGIQANYARFQSFEA